MKLLVTLIKISLIIFVAELVVMTGLESIGPFYGRGMLDALLLVCIASPFLYQIIIKPYIQSLNTAQEKTAELQEREEQLRLVLDGAELGFWDWDMQSGKVIRNERWADILGYTFEELQNTTQQWTDFIYPEDRDKAWQSISDVIEGRTLAHKIEYRMLHKDGSIRWILDQAKVMKRDASGKPTRMSGTHIDITERKKIEEEISENSLRFNRILDNLFAYVALLDVDGVIEVVNKTPLERAGYRREDVIGQYFYDAPWWNYDQAVREQLIAAMDAARQGVTSRYDVVVKMGDDFVPIDFLIAPVYDAAEKIVGLLPTAVDITERKQLEEELTRQAHLDYLTGLFNRRYFTEQAEVELSRAVRYDSALSILMLDIDNFKLVNDTYGHLSGDIVLRTLAGICQDVLRNFDVIGRMGGEEFAVVLPETNIEQTLEVAERLREVIAGTKVLLPDGDKIHFTVSIGISTLVDKRCNIDWLLNHADKALYAAKDSGRNRTRVATGGGLVK